MVRIRIPASTANLGSGFDCLGAALSLYNYVTAEEWDGCEILSLDGSAVPPGDDNLVYKSAKRVFELCGKPFFGLRIGEENNIPMARGLGSSSACIVGGLCAGNELLGRPLSRDELLGAAAELEGHPDNVSPALLGGFTVSVMDGKAVRYVRHELPENLVFAAFVPDFELRTADARSALPKEVPMADAVFDLSRAALMTASICDGKYENLRAAADDRLHQPYRLPLIPGAEELIAGAYENGALAAFISGAGSTVMAIYQNSASPEKAFGCGEFSHWRRLALSADNCGTAVDI